MILKINYNIDKEHVYVFMYNDELKISWFTLFPYDSFFERYYMEHDTLNTNMLSNDLVDTYINNVASVPYTKEEIINNINIKIYSDLIKNIEL